MSEFNNFFNEVFEKFNQDITDKIFLMIENDPELMGEYSRLTENGKKDKDNLNTELGKAITTKYNLKSLGRNDNPKSTLIENYTEHK